MIKDRVKAGRSRISATLQHDGKTGIVRTHLGRPPADPKKSGRRTRQGNTSGHGHSEDR
jgi:hypothetical protein